MHRKSENLVKIKYFLMTKLCALEIAEACGRSMYTQILKHSLNRRSMQARRSHAVNVDPCDGLEYTQLTVTIGTDSSINVLNKCL